MRHEACDSVYLVSHRLHIPVSIILDDLDVLKIQIGIV